VGREITHQPCSLERLIMSVLFLPVQLRKGIPRGGMEVSWHALLFDEELR